MTEVLSAIFGRKKPKVPVPAPRKVSGTATDQDGFVIVGSSEHVQQAPANGDARNNNMYPPVNQNQSQPNDYESLFSFLKVQPSDPAATTANAGSPLRPFRRAPPVPASRTPAYGLQPTSTPSPSEAQTSTSYYLSHVPFEISKSCGGGPNVQQLNRDVSEALARLKRPKVGELDYTYSFDLEYQVIDEASANKNARIGNNLCNI